MLQSSSSEPGSRVRDVPVTAPFLPIMVDLPLDE
jgi:hypothetical protein